MSRCVPRRRRGSLRRVHRRRLPNGAGSRRRRTGRTGRGRTGRRQHHQPGHLHHRQGRQGRRQRRRGARHRRELQRCAGRRRFGDRHRAPGGAAPDGPNQVVIDEKSAATAGFQLGDTMQLVTTGAEPAVTATMVGTVRFGETGNLIGATLALFDTPTAQRLYLGGADVYNDIAVTGDGSLSNSALRDEIAATLPAGPGGGGRRRVRRREPGPAGAGAVVHHHVPAGVRRRCAGGRHAS